ncbi:MAG: hypothetical protein NTY22_04380 [Proteobacteria bacterium]|nr:hypothetical protein [Pseudomonadota bacterium]
MNDEAKLRDELEKLKAENEMLKSKRKGAGEITFKVSTKGALSVYGLGRFPVTLYREQWERLLVKIDDLKKFINDNKGTLKTR